MKPAQDLIFLTHWLLLSKPYRAFACDVMTAMLVYQDKRILNIFFWKYTNMAANFFVVLIPRQGRR